MKKYDVTALGELLIDFTENGISPQGNPLLEANPGGAPCNVLAMLSKLGKHTAFIGKVGADMFGRQLSETIKEVGICADGLVADAGVPTTLAFVHTFAGGEREFSFIRDPGADMMLTRQVSGCKASASCCGVISPAALGGSKVTVKPCACSACKVCSTAWCSIWVEMMCRLPAAAPRAAPVYKACTSDSVPPLVKVISAGRAACSTRATVRRASSTSLRACWPGRYNADGLPQASSSAVRMASSAAGQGRVVAALSRYIMEKSSR